MSLIGIDQTDARESKYGNEFSSNEETVAITTTSDTNNLVKMRRLTLLLHENDKEKKANNEYVIERVRGKEDRSRLEAYDCPCCSGYYNSLNLTEEERNKRMQSCSRHRGTTGRLARSQTPPGFWDTKIPSTPEAIEQGMMTVGDEGKDDIFEKLGVKKKDVIKSRTNKRKSDEHSDGSQTSPISSRRVKSKEEVNDNC